MLLIGHFGEERYHFGYLLHEKETDFCLVQIKQLQHAKVNFYHRASSGLGKATARLFQRQGWNVIATMRNPEKETALNQLDHVTILPLEVTNTNQIKETVTKAISLHTIDVVLNSAGYGLVGPLEALSDDQINQQVLTNLLGVIHVTKSLLSS